MSKTIRNNGQSLVNLSNSILKHYNIPLFHPSLPQLDAYLKDNYKHVVVLLMDGLGSANLQEHATSSIFTDHLVCDIQSVFPATTTAATTSMLSGLYPIEHGWLGWDLYVRPINETVTMFRNVVKNTNRSPIPKNVIEHYFSYQSIIEKINQSTFVKAYAITPYFGITYNENVLSEMYDLIQVQCNKEERNFTYAYTPFPDSLMHDYGIHHSKVHTVISSLNHFTKQLMNQVHDTLLIVVSDHGHIDVDDIICLSDYPDLQNMLERETSIEPRAVNFFIKEGYHALFKEQFNALFSNHFILLDKQTILDDQWFGIGTPHPQFSSSLGDFMAVATGSKAIVDDHYDFKIMGMHAGLKQEETTVPLIVIPIK